MDRITEEKIKNAVNIVDVIGDFVELRKSGVNYEGLCPFHDDHNLGSFKVNPARGIYKCFACNKGGDAIEFLMDKENLTYIDALRYLAQKYSIFIDEDYDRARFANIKPSAPRKPEDVKPMQMLTVPRDIVAMTTHFTPSCQFIRWIKSLKWDTDRESSRLKDVLYLYCVGTWNDGRVVFWQIDERGQVRSGKLMHYHEDGHRDKSRNPSFVHAQRGIRERLNLAECEYRPTLFGMHLAKRYPSANIHIVESEKTALICATHYGDIEHNLWMACGGLQFLKWDVLRPLIEEGRTIYLWPDKDGVSAWETAKNTIIDRYDHSAKLHLNTDFISKSCKEEDGPKADVADVIIRIMNERPQATIVKCDGNPYIPQDELNDPDLHAMRMKMSRVHSKGWGKWPTPPTCDVDGVQSVGEILQQNPILKQLIQ